MKQKDMAALVLAAGKGTRMKSERAKVLHEVLFAPMLHHVLDALRPLALARMVVVTGHQRQTVEASLRQYAVEFARQEEQLGTGHAVLSAEALLDNGPSTVLILCGDTPLIRTETLASMIDQHLARQAQLTVMTTHLEDPTNYGRIVVGADQSVQAIVEEKDATPAQRRIGEVNAGIYCVATRFLFEALKRVGTDNKQGEIYLTDIVEIARQAGQAVDRFLCLESEEVLGVNSRVELAEAHRHLQQRVNRRLMRDGVTLLQPETISIAKQVEMGSDTVVHPGCQVSGASKIGRRCTLGPQVVLKDCMIGDDVVIGPFSLLEGEEVPAGAQLGPFSQKR